MAVKPDPHPSAHHPPKKKHHPPKKKHHPKKKKKNTAGRSPLTGLGAPMSEKELRRQAEDEVRQQILDEISPFRDEIASTTSDRDRAERDIEGDYNSVMPYLERSAARVSSSHADALANERGIFSAASSQLSALKAERGNEAQRLAQELGAPVPLEGFTDPVSSSQQDASPLFAGKMLETLGQGEAEVNAAEAFSGQVFPLLRTEAQRGVRRTAQDTIDALKREIAHARAKGPGMTNTRYQELKAAERQFQLTRAQANRDWLVAKQSLRNEGARLGFEEAGVTGEFGGGPTLAATSEGHRHQEAMLSMTKGQKANKKQYTQGLKMKAGEFIDAALTDKVDTLRYTKPIPISERRARTNPNAFRGENGVWYVLKDVTEKVQVPGVKNPNKLYDFLRARGIPAKMALNTIRLRLGIPHWVYGEALNPNQITQTTPGAPGGSGPAPHQ